MWIVGFLHILGPQKFAQRGIEVFARHSSSRTVEFDNLGLITVDVNSKKADDCISAMWI